MSCTPNSFTEQASGEHMDGKNYTIECLPNHKLSGTLAKLDVLTNIPTNMFINPVLCLKLVFKTYLVIIGWIEIKL